MVKCSQCDQSIPEGFLGKIQGTHVKEKGKLKALCSSCQKEYEKSAE